MSRTPNSRKEETRERIVDAAGRAIRRHGYAGVGVANVMKEAGLTHGGFYAHFDSRDALLVEALERASRQSLAVARAAKLRAGKGVSAFRSLVETYLADDHLASLETGCPVAALGCEMPILALAEVCSGAHYGNKSDITLLGRKKHATYMIPNSAPTAKHCNAHEPEK